MWIVELHATFKINTKIYFKQAETCEKCASNSCKEQDTAAKFTKKEFY